MGKLKMLVRCTVAILLIPILILFLILMGLAWIFGFLVVLILWAHGDNQWDDWLQFMPQVLRVIWNTIAFWKDKTDMGSR